MARIALAPGIVEDFDRIIDHPARHDAVGIESRLRNIVAAIDVLERNPLIGHPARGGLRELVIGRDARGYVALYRYLAASDTVLVLAIRSQQEAGHAR